ncbi:LPS translocon maturation chaperone LptM [Neiella marina]|uniref:LPS translocon maturation chaperone LptM n=1 Tax=Neiella marina TaxID=508461 RepID=UPI000B3CF01D
MRNNLRSRLVGAALLALMFSLSGCGQKGPLYLPEEPQQQPQPTDEPEQPATEPA